MRVKELFAWIRERHAIYERRKAGKPRPWTKDPILQTYKFCNVYRELDKVTVWIRENWREPNATVPHLWFAMCVARLVNWPETLDQMVFPVPWRPKNFLTVMHQRKEQRKKCISAAYVVSTNGVSMDKAQYLATRVLGPLWEARAQVMPRAEDTLASFAARLQKQNGFAGFMAGQVVADTKFTMPLHTATDWWTWAVSGPGSRRGLNRVMEREVKSPWKEVAWRLQLSELRERIDPLATKFGLPRISAQDLQNCLCEFDKNERERLGEGHPKALFDGRGD